MIISKILNNNSIISYDGGIEKVIMGKGIAFNKVVGDFIDKKKVQKEFVLDKNDSFFEGFKQILVEVPVEQIEIVDEIVDTATIFLKTKLLDNIYLTLTDHINYALKRAEEHIELKNALLWDIQKFYPNEYKMGLNALKIINEKTGIQLLDDEAGFIAIHFVNAQQSAADMVDTYKMTKLLNDVLKIVETFLSIEFDENSLTYTRFITHLQFFSRRIIFNVDREIGSNALLTSLKSTYPVEFQVVQQISSYVNKHYQEHITESEQVYLLIHISKITGKT